MIDYIIVGAGPAGLACAIDAKKKGMSCLLIDKGCIVNSIYNFPVGMTFFSTPDRLQIGECVFVTEAFRPSREQVLNYYLSVVRHYGIDVALYRKVTEIVKRDSFFDVTIKGPDMEPERLQSRKVILATGYYDNPNMLGVEGEKLAKVSHYYTEPHDCYGRDIAVIGGKNSAVEASMAYARSGARVTLIHRGGGLGESVKYWIRPDMEKMMADGKIKAMFNTAITRIEADSITVRSDSHEEKLKNDKVFALTGYHPDTSLMERCGVTFDADTLAPSHNPDNLETNVPGLHIAGSIAAGKNCNKIFIENSRLHGKMVIG